MDANLGRSVVCDPHGADTLVPPEQHRVVVARWERGQLAPERLPRFPGAGGGNSGAPYTLEDGSAYKVGYSFWFGLPQLRFCPRICSTFLLAFIFSHGKGVSRSLGLSPLPLSFI